MQGGRWVTEQHGFMSLPLYVRPGSIIPVGAVDDKPDYDFADGVELHIFAPEEGKEMRVTVPNLKGMPALQAQAVFAGGELSVCVEASGAANWKAVLPGVSRVASVKGGTAANTERGIVVTPDASALELTIGF